MNYEDLLAEGKLKKEIIKENLDEYYDYPKTNTSLAYGLKWSVELPSGNIVNPDFLIKTISELFDIENIKKFRKFIDIN